MSAFRKWVDLPRVETDVVDITTPGAVDFSIIFNDDDELKGKTMGFNVDRNGLFLFPTQKPGYFIYTFIPHHVIKHHQVGPKIGEQLIDNDLVSTTNIDSALTMQQDKRAELLGEYFKRHALVTTQELEEALGKQSDTPNVRLGDVLVREKLITQEQLDLALVEQKNARDMPLGELLIKSGHITQDQLQLSLAEKMGIPFVDISKLDINADVHLLVPREIIQKYSVMPLSIFNGKLIIAMEDPLNWKILEAIRFAASKDLIAVMASEEDIQEAIKIYYTDDLDGFHISDEDGESEPEEETLDDSAISENLVVRLANKIVIDAFQQNVSDIHIEPYPGKKKTVVRFRKDGVLIPYHTLSPKLRRTLIARYKVMAHLDISERRKPQDGKINFARFSRLKLELRVITIPTAGDEEDIVIRLLAAGEPIPIEDMQLSSDNRECIKYLLTNPHGLFFVCGPTGSGKTTLLHSLLKYLNTPDKKIWTVEDPVEITQVGLRQVQVHPGAGVEFSTALRSFLRGDPDIIMVGEMRDKETTEMGIEASLAGHLVLSTLHTNSAAESIVRLLEMGMDPYNFSDALLGIVAQRLVRKLCGECKQLKLLDDSNFAKLLNEYTHQFKQLDIHNNEHCKSDKVIERWKETYADDKGNFNLYEAVGCKACDDTGYAGRIGVQEMLMVSDAIRVEIYRKESANEILKMSLAEGMTTLKQDGIEKVLQGFTDIKQIRKVS